MPSASSKSSWDMCAKDQPFAPGSRSPKLARNWAGWQKGLCEKCTMPARNSGNVSIVGRPVKQQHRLSRE